MSSTVVVLPAHLQSRSFIAMAKYEPNAAWSTQVENGTPDIYRFSIECGDAGCVKDQFQAEFGMSMQVENGASNDWQHDISQVLFPLLHVVDSWDSYVYGRVRLLQRISQAR